MCFSGPDLERGIHHLSGSGRVSLQRRKPRREEVKTYRNEQKVLESEHRRTGFGEAAQYGAGDVGAQGSLRVWRFTSGSANTRQCCHDATPCSRPRQDPISYPQIGGGAAGSLARFALELTLPARGANVVRDPMETGPIGQSERLAAGGRWIRTLGPRGGQHYLP